MDKFLPKWLDSFLLRHPAMMTVLTLAMALVAAIILIASGRAIIAYEAF